ncbi:hypothetical protein F5B20DRAFT_597462 [Whalleya microplaca]|nr:hypothetical protein F5B20DRAFT_597462 [Whalleya microplaca]
MDSGQDPGTTSQSPPSPQYHRHPLFPRLSLTKALPLHLALPASKESPGAETSSRMMSSVSHDDSAMPESATGTGPASTGIGPVAPSLAATGSRRLSPRRRSVESLLDGRFSPGTMTRYSKLLWGSSHPTVMSEVGQTRLDSSILASNLRNVASEGTSLRHTYQASDQLQPFRQTSDDAPQAPKVDDQKSKQPQEAAPSVPRPSRSVRFILPEKPTRNQTKEQENRGSSGSQKADAKQNTVPTIGGTGDTGVSDVEAAGRSAGSHKRLSRAPVLPELDFTREDKQLQLLFDTSRDFTTEDLLELAEAPIPAPLRLNSVQRRAGMTDPAGQRRLQIARGKGKGKGPAMPDPQT